MKQRVERLIKKERELLLRGKGAVESAKEQLYAEEAEQYYKKIKAKPQYRKRYKPSSDERIGKWASNTADMLYNRKKKRGAR